MRFAVADPPYPGKAKRYYGQHRDYAGEVDFPKLIARLERDFPDGWALFCGQHALGEVLSFCPPPLARGAAGGGTRQQYRVLSWCKPAAQPGMGGPSYGWEPIILTRCRRAHDNGRPLNGPRDWIVCSPEMYTFRRKPDEHVTGAKPPAVMSWLFECMGARPDDEVADLFPGSGAVTAAWDRFRLQPRLDRHGEFEQLEIA